MDDKDNLAPDVSPPQADVTLPNGRHLQAAVIRRRRDRSGVWWYDLEIELPDRVDDRRHGPALTSRKVTFCAPHPVVQGIEGEDYSSLDLPPPEHRKRWRLSPPPQGDGWADAYLHRLACAQAASEGGLVTDEEALEALGGPDITAPCPVCRPDTVVQHGR
ncbi:DUF6233 domain-containing protein [Streptomyces lydicamycinicus]|uniref:DUF6233 domain-containing protein n=1 Tax=Streptomyces lydicamycinicus TaxID=1546107 RepID=UPI003C2F6303